MRELAHATALRGVHPPSMSGRHSPLAASAQALVFDLVDVIWPRDCCVCGAPGRVLCQACRRHLAMHQPRWSGDIDHRVPIITSGDFTGVLHDVVWAYKEHRIRSLATPLGGLLAEAIASTLPTPMYVGEPEGIDCVGIPMSARAHWNRGDDLVGRILDVAIREARASGLLLQRVHALQYVRPTKDQRHLGAQDRWTNVTESLTVRRRSRQPVIVVDDVITTGATVSEAVRALTHAGVHVHAVVAIARTALR